MDREVIKAESAPAVDDDPCPAPQDAVGYGYLDKAASLQGACP